MSGLFYGLTPYTFPQETKYYEAFKIRWEMSCTNTIPWLPTGESENPVYICLGILPPPKITPFRTTVHLACKNAGAKNQDEAVLATWKLFQSLDVTAWDELASKWTRKLFYYKPDTTFTQNARSAAGSGAAALLQQKNSSGQCSTWRDLLYDACSINGAAVARIRVDPDHRVMLIKNWIPPATPPPWRLSFQSSAMDMTGGVKGAFQSTNGLRGQNSPTPSQKVFRVHEILRYTTGKPDDLPENRRTTYYDPSYGKTYRNEAQFQTDAVDAFASRWEQQNDRFVILLLLPDPNAIHIKFLEHK